MHSIQIILITIVTLIHFYIMYLEMVLWSTKKGIKTFNLRSKEHADDTKIMAANQGLYNGFLAFGLLWSMYMQNTSISCFFLICISVAGLYGAYSTKIIRIFYIQTIPACLALFSLLLF